VEVVAYLPFSLLAHLRVVLGRHHTLTVVDDWTSLRELLRTQPVDVLVVDPTWRSDAGVPEIRQLRDRYAMVPLVIYTTLSPTSMRAIVELARAGIQDVVLHRVEDEPHRFLALLEGIRGYALGERLVERLGPPLSRLPAATADVTRRVILRPEDIRGVPAFAANVGVPVRTLYRQFAAAGLSSPRMVHEAARLLRAYGYLQDPRCFVEDAAARLGYRTPRDMNRQFRAATGYTGGSLRDALSAEELITLLARRVQTNGR
jgi:AraC-like DNA-binding protein